MSKESITFNKYHLLLVLFVISFVFSFILSVVPISQICDVGEGCDVVHHSKYSKLFGISNSNFGVIIFTILIILTYSQIKNPEKKKEQLIALSILIGSVIAIYFLYLQQFVIGSYCKYCLVVDISMLISLGILIYTYKIYTYKQEMEVEKKP